MHKRTYDTDEITLRRVYARTSTNMAVPAMTVLTADGAGGTYWAIPSTLGYNPSFNQIVTDAGTFTATSPYNTFTLSQGGGIGFVQGAGTNQMYIYSKGFNQINTVGGNSLYGFSNNVTTPTLNFAGAGGISLQANPVTNTLTFTANGQPISTTLNSFQSLKVFPNLSTPTKPASLISSLGGATTLNANNYSSILTLAGTGQISLTPDYLNNTVYIGLNASTLVTSNLTTQIVSTTNVTTSSFTLIDTYSKLQKNLYSENGALYLNGVRIIGGASLVNSIQAGSNIVLGPTGSGGGTQGDVTVNVNTSFLTSTVIGLGTAGYISSVTSGGSINATGLVSTANLVNLVSTSYLASQLGSTVVGFGTAGYLSSLNSKSLSTGTVFTSSINFIDTTLNTVQLLAVNGGTLQLNGAAITGGSVRLPGGLVSTANLTNLVSTTYLTSRLTSTVVGLGTAGYLSTLVISNVNIPNSTCNLWIAVGEDRSDSTHTIIRSTDGQNFNSYAASGGFATGEGYGGRGIAFNGSMWVAVGYGENPIQYSYDGNNFRNATQGGFYTNPASGGGIAVAWNGSLWIAVGSGTSIIQYSSDGTTWTGFDSISGPTDARCVIWNGKYWFVGGDSGGGSNAITRSDTGLSWIGAGAVSNLTIIYGMAWNGVFLIIVGTKQGGNRPIQYGTIDSDGNITTVNVNPIPGTPTTVLSVIWNGTYFVAGVGGTAHTILYSTDGMNWTANTGITTDAVRGLMWDGTSWFALGNTGSNTILKATSLSDWSPVSGFQFSSGFGIAYSSNITYSYQQSNLVILPQSIPLYIKPGNQLLPLSNALVINNTLTINNSGTHDSVSSINSIAVGNFVGINKTNPLFQLDVGGEINASIALLANGVTYTSDRRIKTNISSASLELCYSNILDLPLRSFSFIPGFCEDKIDKNQIGFIADELSTLFPKSVHTRPVSVGEFSTISVVNYEQIQMSHFGATKYMASLLEQQNSTIVGQNANIESLKTDILNLSTAVGTLVSR